jgi:hypothetical protein
MVSSYQVGRGVEASKALFVIRKDGTTEDFSYLKCLETIFPGEPSGTACVACLMPLLLRAASSRLEHPLSAPNPPGPCRTRPDTRGRVWVDGRERVVQPALRAVRC